MFDTYLNHHTSGRSRIDVHEHRAPTDASVKLLKEMEEAADKRRISVMQIESTLFKGVVEVWNNPWDATMTARCVFDLNGHRATAEATMSSYKLAQSRDPLLIALHDEIAKKIGAEVLLDSIKGLRF